MLLSLVSNGGRISSGDHWIVASVVHTFTIQWELEKSARVEILK
jgi:hypothetical protein